MKFGIDKIIETFELAFDMKKMVFMLVGLIIAALGIILNSLVNNVIVGLLGAIWHYVFLMLTLGGVCFLIYQDLKGKGKSSIKDAIDFVKNKAVALIFTPLVLLLGIALVVLIEFGVVWVLSLIPMLGEILVALIIIPMLIINVVLAMALFLGNALIPAIIAVDDSGIPATITKIFEVVRGAPILLISYLFIAMIIATFAVVGVVLVYVGGLFITVGALYPMLMKVVTTVQMGAYMGDAIPMSINIAGIIGGISIGIVTALVLSFVWVVTQGIYTAVYMAIKEEV
ncbi:MAG: hypothetical protein V1843_04065 [bacterium]